MSDGSDVRSQTEQALRAGDWEIVWLKRPIVCVAVRRQTIQTVRRQTESSAKRLG